MWICIIDTPKGYGYAKLPDNPATADTLWYTGSTTKAIVAAAAGILVHNDSFPVFKWSTPLSTLLPGDFVLSEEYRTTHTTLEDALSHRSGLPRHDPSYGWGNSSAIDVVRNLRYLPLSAEPRTRWQYCNVMFGTVGAVLEKHTGLILEEVLSRFIWEPLGMRSTTFTLEKAAKSGHLAVGYHWDKEGESYVPEQYYDIMPVAGAGATISSVNDYALWVKALLDAANEVKNDTNPITPDLVRDLWEPRSILLPSPIRDPTPVTYSLAWMTTNIGEHTVITHSGGLPGFGTQVFLVPALNFGFVSVGNNVDGAAQMGAVLFLALLKDKTVGIMPEEDPDLNRLLHAMSNAAAKPDQRPRHANTSSLPLPGEGQDYVGLYQHPAYGVFNVSIAEADHSSTLAAPEDNAQIPISTATKKFRFLVEPSKRTWRGGYVLTHTSHTFFDSDYHWIHGPRPGDDEVTCGKQLVDTDGKRPLSCRDKEVWDVIGSGPATFDIGLDGKVEKLGIALEAEQVRNAKERGSWRDGMVWFDKAE